jgi:hypothetical protein
MTTEDGVQFAEGDDLFNYYDMKPGTVRVGSTDQQGWFYFDHADGTDALLDGSRVCSLAYAERKGWLP